jgi:2',3'-cyclic-nucleotide 2'-phosphodiesterase (5'-nucleotidase family)
MSLAYRMRPTHLALAAAGLAAAALTACNDTIGTPLNPPVTTTPVPPPPPPAFTLQLLHAADMEGAGNAVADAPRMSAVIAALRATMPANTLTLSSGDNYIPGPFYSASSDISLRPLLGDNLVGLGDIQMLNAMGFQASAMGNHEFDQGTAVIRSLIDRRTFDDNMDGTTDRTYEGQSFPYLSTNLGFSRDTNLGPLVVPDRAAPAPRSISKSVVFVVNGERIGVLGATTPTLATISSPGPNVDITPTPFASTPTPEQIGALATIIQTEVDQLTAAGVNKIILLAHMQQLAIERALALRLRNVDIIVAGGSDSILADSNDRLRAGDRAVDTYPIMTMGADGNPTAIVNTDGQYTYVGRLVAGFDAQGLLLPSSLNPAVNGAYATDAQGVTAVNGTAVPRVQQIADALGRVLVQRESNILGAATVFLNGLNDGTGVRREETNLGNLTADANLFVAQQVDAATSISLKNGGGIRAAIGAVTQPAGSTNPAEAQRTPTAAIPAANKQAGDVSQFDASNALSFNNGLTLINVTAAELKDLLEHGVSGALGAGRFPQVGGLAFSFDLTQTSRTAPNNGQRVRSLVVLDNNGAVAGATRDVVVQNGAIVGDPNRSFRMVTLGFLQRGGDAYPFPAPAGRSCLYLAPDSALPADCTVAAGLPAGAQTFAGAGTEQDALAEFLVARFPRATPFNVADTPAAQDTRIQNLANRADTVLSP